jgi:MFS family permease
MTTTQPSGETRGNEPILAPPPGEFRKTAWGVIWLLTLTILASGTVGGLFSPLQEAAKLDLGLTDIQIGLVQGLAVGLPIAILSLPLAYMVDHGKRTRLLIILAVVWSAGTIATAFVTGFATLFAVRMVAGLGGACVFPVIVSLLADVTMPQRRGRAMVLVSIGAWGGAAAAFAVGGTLYGFLDKHLDAAILGLAPWRQTHLLVGLGSALLILPLLILHEPPRHEVEQVNAPFMPTVRALSKRSGFLIPLFVGQFSGAMAEGAAAIWASSVLIRQYHQTPGQFGGWMGLVILGAGIVGSLIGGFAADAGHRLKMRGGILLAAVIATALTIPAGLYSVMPTVQGFAWVLFALLLGGTIVNLSASAAIAVLVPNEERAVCLAVFKITGTVVGLGLAPPLIGWMSHMMTGPGGLGQALAIVGVVTGIISLAAFWLAMAKAPLEIASRPVDDAPRVHTA